MFQKSQPRPRLINCLLLALMSLALVGCFQSVGESLAPTPVDLTAVGPLPATTKTPFITPLPSRGFIPPTDDPNVTPTVAPTIAPPTDVPTIAPTVAPLTDIPTAVPSPSGGGPTQPAVATLSTPTSVTLQVPTLIATPTGIAVTDGPCVYTVQQGDWLYKIARDHGLDAQQLIAANPGLASRILQPGDTINLPSCKKVTPTPSTPGASSSIATDTPTPTLQANNVPTTAPTTVATPGYGTPTPTSTPYIVAAGDSLSLIARKFNTTVAALKALNNLPNDKLSVGQQLKLPEPNQ